MAINKAERLALIHEESIRQFNKCQTAMRDERLQCLQDRRFYSIAGAQWEGPLGIQFENKPRLEVNKIHLSVIRIINEYRNNRITVNFVSKNGEDREDLADTCSALYRADEMDSCAEEAYDNAFEEAVGGGFGAWRLCTEYEDDEDEDNEYQRIRFKPIVDADSCVFFDLDAKRQDKADAKHAWILSSVTYDAYKEEWDKDPTSLNKLIHQRMFDWLTPDVVYIAEYYKVEEDTEIVYIYQGLDGSEKKVKASELRDDPEMDRLLYATGYKEVRRKKVKRRRVHKYIMNGAEILEDCGYIAGKCIPIVPVYGKRWFVDNVERMMGHVRLAKDPQRIKNMQLSKLAEYAAVSAIEKPIFTPEQVAGHQMMWAEDNIKNYPYLLNNALLDQNGNIQSVGPNAYTKAPDIPPTLAALLQITEADMQDVLGKQEAGEQIKANVSGKAIELIQSRLDMQAFIYVSNMAKAIKRCGEIWLSMSKDVMVDSGRKMKGVGSQGEIKSIELMRPVINEGEIEYENDLSRADFDVNVDVGPSSASKRQATVRNLTGMMAITSDAEAQQVLQAMALMNMEGEGISDVRKFFRRKLIRMGVVEPTQEEAKQLMEEMQAQQPDPQSQYFQAAAAEAQAKAQLAQANTVLTAAKAEETQAKTAEVVSKMDIEARKHLLELVKALTEQGA